MKETVLKLAQQDIDDALNAIETMEEVMDNDDISNDSLKENFIFVSNKLHQLEIILKEEGII